VALVEVGGCIFDAGQLRQSHGFEGLDPVGREAFVNHLHLTASDRVSTAAQVIEAWAAEMRARWPGREFRIYRQTEVDEVIIRFHMVRHGVPNWGEDGTEVFVVGNHEFDPTVAPEGADLGGD
jgi:hypothetical protein